MLIWTGSTDTGFMLVPVDEIDDVTPRPEYEPFYHLAMLEFGDPEIIKLEIMAVPFYARLREWAAGDDTGPVTRESSPAAVLIQYMLWYDREKREAALRHERDAGAGG